MKRGYIDTPHGQMHYGAAGTRGSYVFLLHTSPLTHAEYTGVVPILAERHRVVAFDNPGYGHSDPPPQPPTLADYARPIVAAIDSLTRDRIVLVGTHTGAGIAVETTTGALRGRVSHLVLSGTPLFTPEERTYFRSRTVRPEAARDGSHLAHAWERQVERWGEDTGMATLNWGIACGLWATDAARSPIFACTEYDMAGALARIDCPTLLLNGEGDPLLENDRRAAPLIPGARLSVVPSRNGPSLPYAEPKVFADQILAFIGGR
ncbi:MAG: alpha/beta hydrolase [Alphaproteobacteria bacterium]|nr:alpha/beta hydrolase [Alphaproteobacteria bacterium]